MNSEKYYFPNFLSIVKTLFIFWASHWYVTGVWAIKYKCGSNNQTYFFQIKISLDGEIIKQSFSSSPIQ